MKNLVTREEAAFLRYVAGGGEVVNDPQIEERRLWQPGEGEAIRIVEATGRASCRECGEPIAKGDRAVAFGFDPHAGGFKVSRCYVHAAPCRDYPEEE